MKNKSVSKSVLTGLFVVLALVASNSIVRAQGSPPSTNWSASRGDWFNCNNWSGGCPNPQVNAFINNGGQARIQGEAPALTQSLYLGNNQGDSGGVVIDTDHAILDVGNSLCQGDVYIGNQGSGSVTIANGGRLRNRFGYVAAAPGSYGNVLVKDTVNSQWNMFGDVGNGCPEAGLFIGCTANSNGVGGTALVDVKSPAIISVLSYVDTPSVTVGRSGTLTGNGRLKVLGFTPSSQTAVVFGTLAPTGTLTIEGNLLLSPDDSNSSNTSFHVTPQAQDSLQVKLNSLGGGGTARLGGRVTVIINGTFTPPASFTLLHAEVARINQFNSVSIISLSGGSSCIIPTIDYDDNNVFLRFVDSCTIAEP